jgi:hypothetical protein
MEPNNEPNNFPAPVTDNGKTAGIISYFSIIGWLIAFLAMHKDNKTEIGSYQLRQTLLLYILAIGFYIAIEIIMSMLFFMGAFGLVIALGSLIWIAGIGIFVLWIIGLIGAINGEKKPIPLIGEKAQTMFPGI